jgi:hypothetical protein
VSAATRSEVMFNRWQEDWSVLANPCVPRKPFDDLKYIPFGGDPQSYLSLGADPAARYPDGAVLCTARGDHPVRPAARKGASRRLSTLGRMFFSGIGTSLANVVWNNRMIVHHEILTQQSSPTNPMFNS